MDINKQLYMNVKALCKANGMKIAYVENEICVTPGYLSRAKGISLNALLKIANIFEVSVDELLTGNFSHEFEIKESVEELKTAVKKARQYFNEDGIMNVITPLLHEEEKQ